MPTRLTACIQRVFILAAVATGTVMMLAAALPAQESEVRLGLEGYCPVCIVKASKWEMGSADITSVYDGITYQFPNQELLQAFEENPAKYVPAFSGDCIVCYANGNKRVPGSVDHAAVHNNRLFLFPSDQERSVFENDAAKYESVDLVANGQCVVCSIKMNQLVQGSPEFTEIHDGFRYQFPTAETAAEFQKTPQKYADAVAAAQINSTRSQPVTTIVSNPAVTVTGLSTCAVCEFGVKPLYNPEELGLAVKTSDGGVVVVEGAHQLFPQFYKARYAGQNIQVEGTIVKSQGKVSWLQPSSMRMLK